MLSNLRPTSVLLLGLLLTSCASGPAQQEAAREFWTAIAADNPDKARAYVKNNDLSRIGIIDTLFIEKINLKAHKDGAGFSEVPTEITATERGKPSTIQFSTILEKDNGDWKVDLIRTGESIKQSRKAGK